MASKQIDFVSDAIVNRPKRGCFDNTFEDVSACTKLLLEATKFDDANVSHDVELKIKPVLLKNPLKSCSSCESGVSCIGSPCKRIDAKPEAKKTKNM